MNKSLAISLLKGTINKLNSEYNLTLTFERPSTPCADFIFYVYSGIGENSKLYSRSVYGSFADSDFLSFAYKRYYSPLINSNGEFNSDQDNSPLAFMPSFFYMKHPNSIYLLLHGSFYFEKRR
ncbi:hypothetical protein [Dipodfec virus RodF1_13]|uniref:Uncharacterized protein n=1 Tax=Dipodfec virus RodF1_13 TaxID=2929291 RepID=A0A976N397_9VIRU|nr:hypothetical protein [Dipodfec virus RodF1_13]